MKHFLLLLFLSGCAARLPIPSVNLSPIQEPLLEAQASTKEIKTILANWQGFSMTSLAAQVGTQIKVTESNLITARSQTMLKQKELNDYSARVELLSQANTQLLLANRLQLKWLMILGIGLAVETVGIAFYLAWKLK
jgi:hypothetical protein